MASFESERGGDRPRIGAHVSTAGHIDIAVENAKKINAEAVQIFGAAPQQWRSEKGIELMGPKHFDFDFEYIPIEKLQAGKNK